MKLALVYLVFFILVLTVASHIDDVMAIKGHFEGIYQYINIPSVLIVLLPVLVFSGVYADKQDLISILTMPFTKDKTATENVLRKAICFYQYAGNLALGIGIIGVVVGWIAMANNMDDMMHFGPALQVSLLTLLYAILLKLPCYLAESTLRNLAHYEVD